MRGQIAIAALLLTTSAASGGARRYARVGEMRAISSRTKKGFTM